MENPLNLLRERHGLDWRDYRLQALVRTCAEIIVMQDRIEELEGNMAAAEALGFFDDDEEDEEPSCDNCGNYDWVCLTNGICDDCRDLIY